jgi:hypothetical protein
VVEELLGSTATNLLDASGGPGGNGGTLAPAAGAGAGRKLPSATGTLWPLAYMHWT